MKYCLRIFPRIIFECCRFVRRRRQRDYIEIVNPKPGICNSQVGRMGGKQLLNLGRGCASDVGTPIHEFMHAIGNLRGLIHILQNCWIL